MPGGCYPWLPGGVYVWDGAKWESINVEQSAVAPISTVDIEVNEPANGGTRILTFMTYNLGADPNMSIKEQMAYDTQGDASDITVFGGLYQWGRKDAEHSLRCDMDGADASGRFTDQQYANAADATAGGKFVYDPQDVYDPHDWITPQVNTLWGNGKDIAFGGNGFVDDGFGGLNEVPLVKGPNDPCPDGYRVPTEYEWALLGSDDNSPLTISDGFDMSPGANGTTLSSGLTWVPVSEGYGLDTWVDGATCGYALYKSGTGTDEWDTGNPYTGDLTTDTAPEPLIFLPAGGWRDLNSGDVRESGTLGQYWSSVVIDDGDSYFLYFDNFSYTDGRTPGVQAANPATGRAYGLSVRCIAE
ncbi:MAG: fibrobacter succinogenes major paralogous domain-containing protein [Dysgonamonadaceae bacterium]|nr:fibrobacter succinogenes major paralogous domain-containing protein [Dysgonamonadaceae bacterium]